MRCCDLKITVLPQLGLATATGRFHLRFVSPPNVVPPKPRSASSEALRPSCHSPPTGRPFSFGAPQRSEDAGGRKRSQRERGPARSRKDTDPDYPRLDSFCTARALRRRSPDGASMLRRRSMTELEVTGLSCRRGGRPVVRNISFTVARGELLALTGRNGSGKTTLLRALALLVTADEGAHPLAGRRHPPRPRRLAPPDRLARPSRRPEGRPHACARTSPPPAICARRRPTARRRGARPPSISPRWPTAPPAPCPPASAAAPRSPASCCGRCAALAARRAAERPRRALAGGAAHRAGKPPRRRRPRDRRHPCADSTCPAHALDWSSA